MVDSYRISGKIRDEQNRGAEGYTVQAFDKDSGVYLHPDDRLGKSLSDADGNFEITFGPEAFKDWFENDPKVYLRIRDRDGRVVLETQSKPNLSGDTYFQVKLGKADANPLAPDIYADNLRRVTADFRAIGGVADMSRDDVRVVSELLLRTLNSYAFYRDQLVSVTGYDGVQVPAVPRKEVHSHVTRWDRPVLPQ